MARVQLIIPDEDRDRFVQQARKEGMTFSAWLRAAARARLEQRQRVERFESPEDLKRFFAECSDREGPGREPDWEEHLRTLRESITSGLPGV
ncbi:MAG: antitoxin [Chloroflexi bacterium]|nr:antitoxin [Chloroflexota bacterium]